MLSESDVKKILEGRERMRKCKSIELDSAVYTLDIAVAKSCISRLDDEIELLKEILEIEND